MITRTKTPIDKGVATRYSIQTESGDSVGIVLDEYNNRFILQYLDENAGMIYISALEPAEIVSLLTRQKQLDPVAVPAKQLNFSKYPGSKHGK